jgi:hypothetical protein
METKLTRVEQKEILEKVDRCGAGALEHLMHYMREKQKTIESGTDDWDTMDPYLRGFRQGLQAGFAVASDLVDIAFDKAWIGERLMTEKEYHELLGKAVDATDAQLAAEEERRDAT